ncbi:chemotaxis protein MotB [Dongia mobilis]|uniref:Chemotaxis protein MotB n=1 Tax=Dongia mobilis TaxID=578943 RepID=A0A4R6WRB0_9PROT|nr:flagellar motor protein MotB [Dongia mobilis]TDQ80984.1 chemotaxis protein MotB [Dongia mobilis]
MAADERPIIIKRIKKSGGGHHGGAWKVAYADFVTAMMAFFLLLWLLSSTTEDQKKGLSDYFTPTIAISDQSATVAVLDGQPQVLETMSGAAAAQADIEGDDEESVAGAGGEGPDSQTGPEGATPVDAEQAAEALRAEEAQRFEQVKEQIRQVIDQTPELSGLKDNLQIDQTPEGLRIQLLDKEKESMFASGSATLEGRSQQLLGLVAQAVKDMPNKLAISGHTDATPFVTSDGRGNWELSSDRANAARRVLVQGGVAPAKIATVQGRAETDPFIKENPNDPQNRRISIVLLSDVPAVAPAPSTEAPAPAVPAGPPAEIIPPSNSGG